MKTTSGKTLWALTIYFILLFFFLGVSAMMHYFVYSKFDKVHEHILEFMNVFNGRIIYLFYVPSILLLLSTISLLWFAPKIFPKWAIFASILFSTISLFALFFLLIPLQNSFSPTQGFTIEKYNNLLSVSFKFQLLPILLQSVLSFWLLIKLFSDLKIVRRLIFIFLLALAFYTAGTDFIEKLINYPLWLTIGAKDWMTFRQEGKLLPFLLVYILPSFLPLLLSVMMFWLKPNVIKLKYILLYFGLYLFISIVSAVYFVPKVQLQLNKGYSVSLINDLIRNDFPLRFFPSLLIYILAAFLFIKVAKTKR